MGFGGLRIEGTFLRTRVARRILGLFVLCALVPAFGAVGITYRQSVERLNDEAFRRLLATAKVNGLSVIERLGHLDAALEGVIAHLESDEDSFALSPRVQALLDTRFDAVSVQGSRVETIPLTGRAATPPDLSPAQAAQLESARALLVVSGPPTDRTLWLGRAIRPEGPDAGIVWGVVGDEALWLDGASSEDEVGARLCVLDASGHPVRCPPTTASALAGVDMRRRAPEREALRWVEGDDAYIAESWSASLEYQFGAGVWNFVLVETEREALAILADFRLTFFLTMLLGLVTVLLVGNLQIRRTTEPLNALGNGTSRVAQGDFTHRVEIHSGDEFEKLAGSFNAMTGQLARQFGTLAAIGDIDRAALSTLPTARIVDTVLERTMELAASDGAGLWLLEPHVSDGSALFLKLGSQRVEAKRDGLGPGPGELAELGGEPESVLVTRRSGLPGYLADEAFAARGFDQFLVFPLRRDTELIGAIALAYEGERELEAEERAQLRQLADRVVIALENSHLLNELDELSRGTITALARTIDAKSHWTAGHSERVTELAVALGRELELPDRDLDLLYRGGLLHDIGKIGVPAAILDKPGRLTPEEIREMESHTTIGATILQPIVALRDIIPIVLHHHERWDGGGYPEGLAGEDIPFLARVVAVSDVFDALISDRPYRAGMDVLTATDVIRGSAGTHLDSQVVEAFLTVGSRELDIAPEDRALPLTASA